MSSFRDLTDSIFRFERHFNETFDEMTKEIDERLDMLEKLVVRFEFSESKKQSRGDKHNYRRK